MDRIQQFFMRIGMDPDTPIRHDIALLREIQSRSVCAIAYENLDIVAGNPLDLSEEGLFRKIVTEHRGGYCFETNGLLSLMLREMGFSVTERFARYLRGETGIPMRRHRLVIVQLPEEAYLCDIGIGQTAPRYPVKIEEYTEQAQGAETYRMCRDARHGWVLQELKDGSWQNYLCFSDDEADPVDFVQPSFFCERHPDSVFNKADMVAIKTVDGRCSLDGRVYKRFRGGELIHMEENISDERRAQLLREVFLLNV